MPISIDREGGLKAGRAGARESGLKAVRAGGRESGSATNQRLPPYDSRLATYALRQISSKKPVTSSLLTVDDL